MEEKHHQHKLHGVKPILGASIGAGCSNQMQLAQGHYLNADLASSCATCIWFALVVFFLGALAQLLMCTQANRHTLQLALCGGSYNI